MMNLRKRHGVPGLNTTSTADISFMLLIFFLVTTSMDVDKGLLRQLPMPEPQHQKQQSTVDKSTLMALHVTGDGKLLLNEHPIAVKRLKGEVISFVHRLGTRHLISIESDRDARYDLYFQMQNQLMMAYSELRDEFAKRQYGKSFSSLTKAQKDEVRKHCPQRLTESYADAQNFSNKSVSADAEEKQGDAANQYFDAGKQKPSEATSSASAQKGGDL